jgi:ribosomal protein S18 acetylase RimI-like enzyme
MIRIATAADIPALVTLINNAYRGEESKKGWTTEAHLISGTERVDPGTLQSLMDDPHSIILVRIMEDKMMGSVYLQKQNDKLYLGMLSVVPSGQNAGVGRSLLEAAQDYSSQLGCIAIRIKVISIRTELIDWYVRRGFHFTGEQVPFPATGLWGQALQELHFVIMEKPITR